MSAPNTGRARIPLVVAIVASLVLGTASLAYGQTAGRSDRPQRQLLASEPLTEAPPVPPPLDAVDEELVSVLESIGTPEPGDLLDELADKLEAAADPSTDSESAAVTVEGPAPAAPGVVHLTFDDGPHPVYTPAILDILARYDAKATFFVLGSLVETHPELIDRIVAEGHTVANHSWSHRDLTELTRAEFRQSVGRTQAALGPHATPCLRPPFGAMNAETRRWAAELGLEVVLWTTDTRDWQKPGVDVIADRIVSGADGGSPILLHDAGGDRAQTVEALDRALRQLADRGLTFEPVCQRVDSAA